MKMANPKFYILNVRSCDPKDIGPIFEIGEFVVMDGQYCCDYDVVEELLPHEICNAHRFETPFAKMQTLIHGYDDETDYLPLGFNKLPSGAELMEIEKQ
jgi:hypothetical protein